MPHAPRIGRISRIGWIGCLAAGLTAASAKSPQPVTSLESALAEAKAGHKLLFLQYGREACGNCQALKTAIAKGQVKLDPDDFVYADLNCDDPATQQAFDAQFRVTGSMLPFVVIADSEGKQLAGRSGYGTPGDYTKFIKDARRATKPASRTSRGRPGGPPAKKPAGPAGAPETPAPAGEPDPE